MLLVIYVACDQVSAQECRRICPAIYKPVCGGYEGGPYKTFGNSCGYNYANCMNDNGKNIYFQITTVTVFSNFFFSYFTSKIAIERSSLSFTEFEILSQWECEEECSQACLMIYEPVCAGPKGGEGPITTYPNDCVYKVENCKKSFTGMIIHFNLVIKNCVSFE